MANRYWVAGGNGNWSSTTNWSATSGGASGASAPGSADIALFDANSGNGTATVDSNITIQALTMTGFTGTLAFGTNTITLTNAGTVYTGATTFTVTGAPVRWRDDNTAPTASVGMPLAVGVPLQYDGDLSKIKFIEQSASAKLNISYYC